MCEVIWWNKMPMSDNTVLSVKTLSFESSANRFGPDNLPTCSVY